MPIPKFMARINKRTFNKLEIKRGVRPVITHVGRSSGKAYHTPLDAHQVDNGFIFFPLYGPDSDWVKNVLATGTATLKVGDDEFELISPRLVTKEEALRQLPASTKPPANFLGVTDYLLMDSR